jgi:hypothetical protein
MTQKHITQKHYDLKTLPDATPNSGQAIYACNLPGICGCPMGTPEVSQYAVDQVHVSPPPTQCSSSAVKSRIVLFIVVSSRIVSFIMVTPSFASSDASLSDALQRASHSRDYINRTGGQQQ